MEAIAATRPRRAIDGDNGEPYLERFYLAHLGPAARPWAVAYLHRFAASGPDLGYHDHPWPWAVSLVLSGWYVEAVPDDAGKTDVYPARPGRLAWFGGAHKHRVVLPHGGECWTLFVHGPWRKPWGFFSYQTGVRVDGRSQRYEVVRHYRQYSAESSAGWWNRV